jgi:hypothetical protein
MSLTATPNLTSISNKCAVVVLCGMYQFGSEKENDERKIPEVVLMQLQHTLFTQVQYNSS